MHEEMKNVVETWRILVGKPKGKDLGADGRVIKSNLRETRFEEVYWIHLAQDRD
jgi:hypothetical protein